MKKRALSLLLVFVMALGLAAPALAEGDLFLAEEPAAPEDMGAAAPADPVPAEAEAEPADAPVDVPAPIAAAPMEADIPMPADVDYSGAGELSDVWEQAKNDGKLTLSANATVSNPLPLNEASKDITVSGNSNSIEGKNTTVFNVTNGSLTLSGVTVYSVGSDAAIVVSENGKLTISDPGVKVGTAGTSNNGKAISVTGGTVDISAGSFGELNVTSGDVTLSGGTFTKITAGGADELKKFVGDDYYYEKDGRAETPSGTVLEGVTVKKTDTDHTAPKTNSPQTYTGEPLTLIASGQSIDGGTYKFAVQQDKPRDASGYDLDEVKETEAGEYTVWWIIEGDATHKNYIAEGSLTVTISKAKEETPGQGEGYTINYKDETITSKTGYEVKINSDEALTENMPKSITDALDQGTVTIHVVKKSTDTTNKEDSESQDGNTVSRPSAPESEAKGLFSGLILDKNKITLSNSTDTYQYAIGTSAPANADEAWKNGDSPLSLSDSTGWENLGNNKAYVRIAATSNTFASKAVEVEMVSGKAELSGSYKVGEQATALAEMETYQWYSGTDYPNGSTVSTGDGTTQNHTVTAEDLQNKNIWYTATKTGSVGTLRSTAATVGAGTASYGITKVADFNYDGQEHELLNSPSPVTNVKEQKFVVNDDNGNPKLSYKDVKGKDAGTYNIKYTATAEEGYQFAGAQPTTTGELEVIINKFEMTFEPASTSVPYSGDPIPVTVTQASSDGTKLTSEPDAKINVFYEIDGQKKPEPPVGPGEYKVYASVTAQNFTISGADGEGYKEVGTLTITHVHEWDTDKWEHDEEGHHWHPCKGVGECTMTDPSDESVKSANGYAEHTWESNGHDGWVTDEDDLCSHRECTVCHYVERSEHKADPNVWQYNEEDGPEGKHYKVCKNCGLDFDHEAHELEPTGVTGDNYIEYQCTVCKAKFNEPFGVYPVKGTVKQASDSSAVQGATVELVPFAGGASLAPYETGHNGEYDFPEVKPGVYTLKATKDGVTATSVVEVVDKEVTADITMPVSKVSVAFEYDVADSDTPRVTVGGLDQLAAQETNPPNETIKYAMSVTAEEESEVDGDTLQAIKAEAGSQSENLSYLDVTIKKIQGSSSDDIHNTPLITLIVSYDFSNKENVTVYRYHEGEGAAKLTEGSGRDGTYKLDMANGVIHIYAEKFSVYAIGYTVRSYSGGGGTTAVDKSALKAAIAAAQALKGEDYTTDSWSALEAALSAAKTVDGDAKATQVQVNAALAALTTASSGLVKKGEEPGPSGEILPPAGGTGWRWVEDEQTYYYFKDGKRVGDYWIGFADGGSAWANNWYYADANGRLLTGFQYLDDLKGGKAWYMLQTDNTNGTMGKMLTGWQWTYITTVGTGYFSPKYGSQGACTYTTQWGEYDAAAGLWGDGQTHTGK